MPSVLWAMLMQRRTLTCKIVTGEEVLSVICIAQMRAGAGRPT